MEPRRAQLVHVFSFFESVTVLALWEVCNRQSLIHRVAGLAIFGLCGVQQQCACVAKLGNVRVCVFILNHHRVMAGVSHSVNHRVTAIAIAVFAFCNA